MEVFDLLIEKVIEEKEGGRVMEEIDLLIEKVIEEIKGRLV